MAIDLFTPLVPKDRLHPSFAALVRRGYEPAKRMLAEIASTYDDKDGNFVKDFQTTGFDARMWELYLHIYLQSDGFTLNNELAVPDFIAIKEGRTVCIEAVTVNSTDATSAKDAETKAATLDGWDLFSYRMQNVYPIKFGSPLFSKLKKRYWELDQVAGHSLVFAIEDFQESGSMVWTSTALELYLYGQDYGWYHDVNGELVVVPETIDKHRHGAKQVPSGFFAQPDSEYVAAVLFSNSATISKFNRLGFLKGHRPKNLMMIRAGACYNHQPHATEPLQFKYVVGAPNIPVETWSEGLSMFHNPNALLPVPRELFPGIAHHSLDSRKRMRSDIPKFHPYGSVTQILNFVDEVAEAESQTAPSTAFLQMLEGKPPVGENVVQRPSNPIGVRQISRTEFRSYAIAKGKIFSPAMEKSWYADDKGLIGTVFLDVTDQDWNYVILAAGVDGLYRWAAGNGSFGSEEKAAKELVATMSNLQLNHI